MSNFSQIARGAMITALLAGLTGCGGGGGSDNPPQQANPPPPAAPAPPPAAPAPPPTPPPAATVPPVATTVQDLTDNHKIGVDRWPDPQTDGTPRAGFNCVVNPPNTVSVYAHVTILLNGEAQAIPRYVGASAASGVRCFYPIHTDFSSGRIHVISATAGTFTLGQLFEIWGQPLTNTNIGGITGLPVEVFVTDSGTVTKIADTDWSNIELLSHREITIGVGTPVTEIPNYTWAD
jgi:hypothetical protein